jgi:hypothetical protein
MLNISLYLAINNYISWLSTWRFANLLYRCAAARIQIILTVAHVVEWKSLQTSPSVLDCSIWSPYHSIQYDLNHMYICTASVLYCSGQSPGRCSRYLTHLFPNSRWSLRMMASSLGDHGPCLICGLRWFRYLSRHCLPVRGAILTPMVDLIYSTCAVRSIIPFYVMVMHSLPVSIRIMSLY